MRQDCPLVLEIIHLNQVFGRIVQWQVGRGGRPTAGRDWEGGNSLERCRRRKVKTKINGTHGEEYGLQGETT